MMSPRYGGLSGVKMFLTVSILGVTARSAGPVPANPEWLHRPDAAMECSRISHRQFFGIVVL